MEKPLGRNRGGQNPVSPTTMLYHFRWHCGSCFEPSEVDEERIEIRGTDAKQAEKDALTIAKVRHRGYQARCRSDLYVRIRLHKASRFN